VRSPFLKIAISTTSTNPDNNTHVLRLVEQNRAYQEDIIRLDKLQDLTEHQIDALNHTEASLLVNQIIEDISSNRTTDFLLRNNSAVQNWKDHLYRKTIEKLKSSNTLDSKGKLEEKEEKLINAPLPALEEAENLFNGAVVTEVSNSLTQNADLAQQLLSYLHEDDPNQQQNSFLIFLKGTPFLKNVSTLNLDKLIYGLKNTLLNRMYNRDSDQEGQIKIFDHVADMMNLLLDSSSWRNFLSKIERIVTNSSNNTEDKEFMVLAMETLYKDITQNFEFFMDLIGLFNPNFVSLLTLEDLQIFLKLINCHSFNDVMGIKVITELLKALFESLKGLDQIVNLIDNISTTDIKFKIGSIFSEASEETKESIYTEEQVVTNSTQGNRNSWPINISLRVINYMVFPSWQVYVVLGLASVLVKTRIIETITFGSPFSQVMPQIRKVEVDFSKVLTKKLRILFKQNRINRFFS
jgi:hypothetical protein